MMEKKKFSVFLAICAGISLLAAGIFKFAGGNYAGVGAMLFGSAYMLIPAVSVILTQLVCGERVFSDIGLSLRLNRWWLVAWLCMVVVNAVAMFASTLLPGVELCTDSEALNSTLEKMSQTGPALGPWGLFFISIGSGLLAGATINALFALAEEVAWRGFLPRVLEGLGFWKKTLLVGAVWGIWHAPVILMGHNYPAHPVAGVFMMVAFCMALAPLLQFLREKCKSVVAPAIAHGTMNATAGLSIAYLSGFNDLLCGTCGAVGIAVLAVVGLCIFLFGKGI